MPGGSALYGEGRGVGNQLFGTRLNEAFRKWPDLQESRPLAHVAGVARIPLYTSPIASTTASQDHVGKNLQVLEYD